MGVGDLKAAKETVNVLCVGRLGDANVDFGVSLGSDNIGPRSTRQNTTIYRQISTQISEIRHGLDELCHLQNGRMALGKVNPTVRSDARNFNMINAYALTSCLVSQPLSRLQNKNSSRFQS